MFNNLKKLRVDEGATARLTLAEVVMTGATAPVVLILAPGEAHYNPALKRAFLDMANEVIVARDVDEKLHEAQVNSRNARAYGRAVIVGWENVRDDAGNAVTCTPEEGTAFLSALIENAPDLAMRVIVFSSNMANFRVSTVGDAPKG